MIYTVTFNPSLDYIVSVKDFALGKTNRTVQERILPGGKGINVSIVLKNLGIDSTALGFTAGFTGQELERRAAGLGFRQEFISLPEGLTRINVKLKDIDGTEINGMGPVITEEALAQLWEKLEKLQAGDVIVLAGSIPGSLPGTMYQQILERLAGKGILAVVDAAGELLWHVLKYRPFLIKPNHHELGELFGVTIDSREGALPYAKKLQEQGARNVLVSMGGQGAVLAAENGEIYALEAPAGRLVNAVGAGDSMVAGFLAGWFEQESYAHAFQMAVAAGSASAYSEILAEKESVMELYAGCQDVSCG